MWKCTPVFLALEAEAVGSEVPSQFGLYSETRSHTNQGN